MAELSNNQILLMVDFGEQGGQFNWESYEECIAWVESLRSQWSWVEQCNNSQNKPQNQSFHAILVELNNVVKLLNHARNSSTQEDQKISETAKNQALEKIKNTISNKMWLLPGSPERLFVENIKNSNRKLEASAIVCYWLKGDLSRYNVEIVVSALFEYLLFERNIENRAINEAFALNGLLTDIRKKLAKFNDDDVNQQRQLAIIQTKINDEFNRQHQNFDHDQQKRMEAWQESFSAMQSELKLLKDTYDNHMALEAPVSYWETKRKKHMWLLVGTGLLSLCAFVASFYYAMQGLSGLISHGAPAIAPTVAVTPGAAPSLLPPLVASPATMQFGVYIVLATLGFWAIRLLVRVFLSHVHLENDAAERVTMVKTYLALIRNDQLKTGDHVNTVFTAIFRPAGDGIVKDEAAPPSLWELVTRK